jgi:uncharacterized protein involved in outer membrane biogenesis
MLALEGLRVRLRPFALLQGRVEVERVELLRPDILLERLADGLVNWRFDKVAESPGGSSAGRGDADSGAGAGMIREVALERLQIVEGRLRYLDAASGRSETVERITAELSARSLSGPFELEGSARYRERALALSVKTGQLGEARLPLSLDIGLPEAGGDARFRGSLQLTSGRPSLEGSLAVKAGRLSRVLSQLGGPVGGPALLDEPLELEGRLAASEDSLSFTSERATLGGQSAELVLNADLSGEEPKLLIDAALPRLDLDALLAELGEATPPPAGGAQEGSGQALPAPAEGFSLPGGLAAELRLSVGALVYRNQVVRELGLDAALAGERLTLTRAVALLPGGSDLNVTGSLQGQEGQAAFDLQIEGASDNLRALLSWLGVESDAVPRDRLRQASVTGRLSGTPQSFNISDLDLRVDLSRLTGGIAVVPGPRPGLGIGLSLDRIDLDAYLPQGAQAGQAAGAGAPGSGAEPAGADAPLPLDLANANLDIRVESLTYRGVTAGSLYLDASMNQGALDLRRLVVGDLVGSYLELSGALTPGEAGPRADLTLQLTSPEPDRLAAALGTQAPQLAKLGPATLAGSLSGGLAALDLDLQLSALSGTLEMRGQAVPLALPPAFDLEISAKHGQLGGLARALEIPGFERATPGALDLSGSVKGNLEALDIDLAASLGEGSYKAAGQLRPGAQPLSFELDLEASHPEARQLWKSFAGPQGPALGALSLKTKASGTAEALTLSALQAALGETSLSGQVAYDAKGARPRFDAQLASPKLQLAALTALGGGAERKAAAGEGGAGAGQAQAPAAKQERWSREVIDLSGLTALDGAFDLMTEELILPKAELRQVSLKGTLDAGLLTLEAFKARYGGGEVLAEGTLDARARPSVSLSLDLAKVESRLPLSRYFDFDRVSGPVSLSGTLQSTGRSEAELVSNLNGLGKVSGSLTLESRPEEQAGNIALTILGQKVGELAGVTSSISTLYSAFAGRPAALSGNYRIEGGVVTSNNLLLRSDRAQLADRLTANLPAWTLDTTADLHRAQDDLAGPPYLTLAAKGPMDEPNLRVSGQAFSTTKQAPAGGATAPGGGGSLQDQLKQVIPGLIPQLQGSQEPQASPTPAPEAASEPEPQAPDPQQEEAKQEEAKQEEVQQAAPAPPPPPAPKPAPPPPQPADPTEALIQGILKRLSN